MSHDYAPLRISANGRYFTGPNGDPFFWMGDTQWQLFRDFSLDDVDTILRNRFEKGFSVIQVMATGTGDGTKPNLDGHTPWLDNNPSTPNPAYFENVDAVVNLARQNGLILAFYLCHNAQSHYINLNNARAYTRWVANRYCNEQHLIWVFVTEIPIRDNLPLIRELAAGIREGAGDRHLISYHPDPVAPALSSGEIHTEEWLDFNMIQTWNYYEGIYGWITRDYNRRPIKPVVMAEGAYEEGEEYGFPVTPHLVRCQAHWSYLSGGFHSYGHNHNWRVPPDWEIALEAPGARHMKILKDVFTNSRWWELIPDQQVFASQSLGGTTLNTAARSENGNWIMVYLSRPSCVTIRMNKITASNQAKAFWIDPRTGDSHPIGIYFNSGEQSFTPPADWDDAFLWITANRSGLF